MSYIEKTLLPGEKVIYRTRLHFIVLLRQAGAGVVLAILGIGAIALHAAGITPGPGFLIAGALALAGAAIFFGAATVSRNATEIAVTNRRVLIKRGILRRSTIELLIARIESVQVNETLGGRLLGYGTVTLRGTGGTPEVFERIENPIEFRRQIQGQIEGVPASMAAG